MDKNKPQVIIINGNSCTGKSFLLKKLTEKLNLPFVSRDEFKEMLFDQIGLGMRNGQKN